MKHIKILLADDHKVIRDGLKILLEQTKLYKIVAEASDGQEALERVAAFEPDIVVLDITMPVMNGMEAARLLKEQYPQVKVVILSMHHESEYITKCLEYDVMGYVVKNDGGNELLRALEAVSQGKKYYSEAVTQAIMEKYREQKVGSVSKNPVVEITNREKEIMNYIAQGYSNQRIADTLFISFRTVETHRANLMRKLDAKNSVDLVNKAREHHLVK